MRKIENKPLLIAMEAFSQDAVNNKINSIRKDESSSYFKMIAVFLKVAPKEGWGSAASFDRLRVRLDLIPKLEESEKVGEIISLEEKEWDELLLAYKDWSWSITSMEILKLDDYLKKEVLKEEVDSKKLKKG